MTMMERGKTYTNSSWFMACKMLSPLYTIFSKYKLNEKHGKENEKQIAAPDFFYVLSWRVGFSFVFNCSFQKYI